MRPSTKAFSLLEMSIVVAMIGLIAGMVFVGQSFANRHKLRSIITDANNYAIAIQQFQAKYQAMPGDMIDATRIWGAVGGGVAQCSDPLTDVSTGTATCNGDGNGTIDLTNCETYRSWQQLAAGGFIAGSFSGVSGIAACAGNSLVGLNIPEGPIKKTGYTLSSFGYYDANNASTVYFDGDYTNAMLFGLETSANFTVDPAIATATAREIDQKVDEGIPMLGSIRTYRDGAANMPNCSVTSGLAYKESYEQTACALFFMNSFARKSQ